MAPQLMVLLSIHDDLDLALVHDGVELALDLGVEDLADVAEAEAGLKVGLRNRIRIISRWPVCITPSTQFRKEWILRSITDSKSVCMFLPATSTM